MCLCGGRERTIHGEWDEVTSHRGPLGALPLEVRLSRTSVLEASRAFPVTCSLGSRNRPVPVGSQHGAGPASMGDDVPILSSEADKFENLPHFRFDILIFLITL